MYVNGSVIYFNSRSNGERLADMTFEEEACEFAKTVAQLFNVSTDDVINYSLHGHDYLTSEDDVFWAVMDVDDWF